MARKAFSSQTGPGGAHATRPGFGQNASTPLQFHRPKPGPTDEGLPANASASAQNAFNKAKKLGMIPVPVPYLPGYWELHSSLDNTYRIHVVDTSPGVLQLFTCTCEAGEHRSGYPVPCWHAAAVALVLRMEGVLQPRPQDALLVRN